MVERADVVLEGGGVKGIGLVGALSVLAEHGYEFEKVAGTSAGAIVGALLAAGMSPAEMHEVMQQLDYERFRDAGLLDRLGPIGKAASVLLENGIYEGRYLTTWLDEQLERRSVRTFADLRIHDPHSSLPDDRRYRLVVMASDLSRGRLRRLPWDYRPCFHLDPATRPVSEAVRASMSLPFFYEPFRLRHPASAADDGRYHEACLVDGGMLSNFPVRVFDRTDGRPPRWPTFGIKLSARPVPERPPVDVGGPLGMTKAMIRTMTSFYDQMHLDDEAVVARTIFVDTTGFRTTDFSIDEQSRDVLFQRGRDAATRFLRTWDEEAYNRRFRPADPFGHPRSAQPTPA